MLVKARPRALAPSSSAVSAIGLGPPTSSSFSSGPKSGGAIDEEEAGEDDEARMIRARYEETNRLLGGLVLGRRRGRGDGEEAEDE